MLDFCDRWCGRENTGKVVPFLSDSDGLPELSTELFVCLVLMQAYVSLCIHCIFIEAYVLECLKKKYFKERSSLCAL